MRGVGVWYAECLYGPPTMAAGERAAMWAALAAPET